MLTKSPKLFNISKEELSSVRAKKLGFQCPLSQNSSASVRTSIERNSTIFSLKKKLPFQLAGKISKLLESDRKETISKKKTFSSNKIKSKTAKTVKKSPKEKFANAPKKSLNAFMYFAESARGGQSNLLCGILHHH